ncbi:MAG: protocatechuate 3,4-dioxygenase subunit alpha [Acidobacteriota bacterium]
MPSASQTVGPFFHLGMSSPPLAAVVGSAAPHRVRLEIRVMDGDGRAIPDALVEIWQVDAAGQSARPQSQDEFSGFGRLATDDEGCCEFKTTRPGPTPDGRGGWQAPHINVCVFARGLLRPVFSRLYFDGDPALASDATLALVPQTRRSTLVARRDEAQPERWVFPIRLQGDQETVFFDL